MQSWIDLKMMLLVMRFQVVFFSFSFFLSCFPFFSFLFSSSHSSIVSFLYFDSPSSLSFLCFLAIYAFLTNGYFYEQILDAIIFFHLFLALFLCLLFLFLMFISLGGPTVFPS